MIFACYIDIVVVIWCFVITLYLIYLVLQVESVAVVLSVRGEGHSEEEEESGGGCRRLRTGSAVQQQFSLQRLL